MSKLYRIYLGITDSSSLIRAADLVSAAVRDATIIETTGIWKGNKERSMIIEIVDTEDVPNTIHLLAKELKEQFKQESVLITWQDVEAIFI
jgi:hypothetical protein